MKLLQIPILVLFSLFVPLVTQAEEVLSPEDQLELEQLMGVLDKHTEIATFTKMNADYIPGMVTVLQGRDLAVQGKRNVMEALTLVPGLDISLTSSGQASMTSRGIGSPYLPATSLIMLDGISMNGATSGSGAITFGIPIEQIERIEIIRGPGASVNGEFAYNSVINIITRKDGNNIHGSYGRYNTYSGGGMASYDSPENNMKFSVNMATSGTEGAAHYYSPDSFGNSGTATENREVDTLFSHFSYNNFTLTGSYIDAGKGDFFSVFPQQDDKITTNGTVSSIEGQQRFSPADTINMVVKIGYQTNVADHDQSRVTPTDFAYEPLDLEYPDGIIIGLYNEEEKISSSLETVWKGLSDNTVTFALSYNYTSLTDTYMLRNVDPLTYEAIPWQKFTGDDNFMDEDATRNHFASVLQDQYSFNEHLTITAGLRYDHYSDIQDDQISPRISGVWQSSEHHIFKIQYAQAYRPPTFLELSGTINYIEGNENINSEIIDTYELSYIFRKNSTIAKITLFYSDLEDLITAQIVGTSYKYTNNASATQTGFELEYKQQLLHNLEFDSNLSYAKTNDDDSDEEVVNARSWLLNLGLTYSPFDWLKMNSQYRVVDDRYRSATDERSDLDGYDVLDVTISYYPQMVQGLTLRTGLKNVFDAKAYVSSSESPSYTSDQAEDYEVLDRFWWVQASYDF